MNTTKLANLQELGQILVKDNPRSFKHISFILQKNKILSIGQNINKTHPIAKKYRFGEFHSEAHAFTRLPYEIKKDLPNNLVLVNFRFNTFGEVRLSKPCSLCLPWCTNIFKKIYYSDINGIKEI